MRQQLAGGGIAHQAVGRKLRHDGAAKAADAQHGSLKLQHWRVVTRLGQWLGVHRQVCGLDLLKAVRCCVVLQFFRRHAQAFAGHGRRGVAGNDAAIAVHPGQALQLWVLGGQHFCAVGELGSANVSGSQVTGQQHDLFLAFQQTQAHALLGVFHIALQGLVVAVDFLRAQIPESGHDCSHEQGNGNQRCQCGQTVLSGGGEAAPPGTPPLRGIGAGKAAGCLCLCVLFSE